MEITTTTKHDILWDFPDSQEFSAEIVNGKITKLSFQDVGELTESSLESVNEKYLRHVHRALEGLFQHLDTIRNVGNVELANKEQQENLDKEEMNLRYLQRDEHEMEEYKERVINSIKRS
ncbi:hypothetical protein H8S90_09085 [Olivibacter sp. SDN3]|uniref:hypothetical protein n=1 Tax=Olivibacter sp. SDN3 TaxID=2764720 RepID=UPI0016511411|nr:hypothetical protein [Olivibacter sp. SDN3]QNL51705.1 hypothetical protein H8S90_09085 [Olivibacter sp. SDN3]